jgi:gliding motility-associated protein GldC
MEKQITSQIIFNITLDDARVPDKMNWNATDSGIEGVKPCAATMISIWDPAEHTTMRIDLWTKDMMVEDMKRFFFENFMSMADTYMRATNDADNSKEIRKFAEGFGKRTGIAK